MKIGDNYSTVKLLNLGVPQGSVLGPILFLVYINSLFDQPFKGKIKAFADDLGIGYCATDSLSLIYEINHDIHLLRTWFAKHKLINRCINTTFNAGIACDTSCFKLQIAPF